VTIVRSGWLRIVKSGLKAGEQIVVEGLLPGPPGIVWMRSRGKHRRKPAGSDPLSTMNFSHFFIRRPISRRPSILIVLAGCSPMKQLPNRAIPEIGAATVVVRAVIQAQIRRSLAETWPRPSRGGQRRENISHVEHFYQPDVMALTITFKLGTDLNTHRARAEPCSHRVAETAEEVRRPGVTTTKEEKSTDLTMVAHLVSPDDSTRRTLPRQDAFLQSGISLPALPGR